MNQWVYVVMEGVFPNAVIDIYFAENTIGAIPVLYLDSRRKQGRFALRVNELKQNARHYIDGRWETGGTTGISENPSDTREAVAEYARADRSQAEQAIRAASDAFAQWGHSGPQRRADALDRVGSELLARKDELGKLLAREEGKTLPEAIAEVARAGQIFSSLPAKPGVSPARPWPPAGPACRWM